MQHCPIADEQEQVCAGFRRLSEEFQRERPSGSISKTTSPKELRLRFCCNAQ
jgi:hypothetical protein